MKEATHSFPVVSKGLHRNQINPPLPSRVDWESSPRLEHLASQDWIQLFYYLPTGKELGESQARGGGGGGCEHSGLREGGPYHWLHEGVGTSPLSSERWEGTRPG